MAGTRELITVDLGNSSCKARLWRLAAEPAHAEPARIDAPIDRPIDEWESPARPGLGTELARWLERIPAGVRAGASSVAARELEVEVERALGDRLVRALGAGLEVEYRTPETLGADRLFAARAAAERCGASCLVVDAGTALTVDAVRVERGAAGGLRAAFVGGAIAPGPRLLARALHAGTARLPAIEPRVDAPALGRDTREALAAGVVHGFRGLVRGLVDAVAREARLQDAPAVLGGGARAWLGEDPLPGRSVVVLDDLVHLGLVAALRERLGAGAG